MCSGRLGDGEGGEGGMRWLDQKINAGFELSSPFLTYTPSFIQIGSKLAKLVCWGGLGDGEGGVGGCGGWIKKLTLDLNFPLHS